jgi:transposase
MVSLEGNDQRRRRLLALWAVRQGESLDVAATMAGVDKRTVRRWLTIYRGEGLAEVLRRVPGHHAAGRRPKLTAEQIAVLAGHVASGTFQTVGDAVTWVQATWGVAYCYQGMHALLRRSGARTKPRGSPQPADG